MLKLRDWIDIDKINWGSLSYNTNAIELLKKNQDKIIWWKLSKNPNAIELLKENQNKINWNVLSINPNAMSLLKENQDKINWMYLSLNSNAIELLKENQEKIHWLEFSKNPNIFTYDYIKLKENMKNSGIVEELMTVIFHPKNMDKWINWGFGEHQDFINFINE